VYDEGARNDLGRHGVLGWLLAGVQGLSLSKEKLASTSLRARYIAGQRP